MTDIVDYYRGVLKKRHEHLHDPQAQTEAQKNRERVARILQSVAGQEWCSAEDLAHIFGGESIAEDRLRNRVESGKVSRIEIHIDGEHLLLFAINAELNTAFKRMIANPTTEAIAEFRRLLND